MSRTLHVVRALCGILRHTGSGISDVDPHGATRGHPACIAATGATRDDEQEGAMSRTSWRLSGCVAGPNGDANGELLGRRRRTIAMTQRRRSRREATR